MNRMGAWGARCEAEADCMAVGICLWLWLG
jgi:hypothetical protein